MPLARRAECRAFSQNQATCVFDQVALGTRAGEFGDPVCVASQPIGEPVGPFAQFALGSDADFVERTAAGAVDQSNLFRVALGTYMLEFELARHLARRLDAGDACVRLEQATLERAE